MMTLAERLYPEAGYQLEATRRVLANVPDGHNDFAPHPRSMPLTRLAGHIAELAGFAHYDLLKELKPHSFKDMFVTRTYRTNPKTQSTAPLNL